MVAAVALACPRAAAQESVAEQLFIEGRALIKAGQYEKACGKFKASHDLDPTGTGTLLNLALCHEKIGKAATAWQEFRQVAAESTGKREDRVTMAREHEAALRPLLSHITIVVPVEARTPGLEIQIDNGPPIPEAGWGTPVPVDPGEHDLETSGPGKTRGTHKFVVGANGAASRVVIAPLVDAPPEPSALAPGPRDSTRRAIGLTVGGAGLVAIGVGAAFGLSASSKNRDATRLCPNDVCADEATRRTASDTLADAHSAATVSNVLIGGGLVLVAGGVVLVLTAPRAAPVTALRATPTLLAGGGGFGLSGEW